MIVSNLLSGKVKTTRYSIQLTLCVLLSGCVFLTAKILFFPPKSLRFLIQKYVRCLYNNKRNGNKSFTNIT